MAKIVEGYRGTETIAQGEAFEPTPANIENRTKRTELDSGLEVAFLSKETRGDASEQGPPLPKTLSEAAERLDASEAARAIFGDDFVSHYVHTRRWEVREYERAVTDWELRRYFEAT